MTKQTLDFRTRYLRLNTQDTRRNHNKKEKKIQPIIKTKLKSQLPALIFP